MENNYFAVLCGLVVGELCTAGRRIFTLVRVVVLGRTVCARFNVIGRFIHKLLPIFRCPQPTNRAFLFSFAPLTQCNDRHLRHLLAHHSNTLCPLRQENSYFLRQ